MTISDETMQSLDTPELLVDLDILEKNVATMASRLRARGVALRPHFKTHKTIQIASMQRQHGACGQTCATLGEAKVLADAGVDDIFIAYPIWPGGAKRKALRDLHERVTLSVGVDSVEAAQTLGAIGAPIRVLVEIDTGGSRTGVRPSAAGAIAVGAQRAGLEVIGVYTHGGHSYGLDDAAQRAARDEVEGMAIAVDAMRREGIEPRVVSAGSTPTALLSADGLVTEERPGTYVFQDRQQVVIGSCEVEDVALHVASTVVSDAVDGQFVIDAGTKCLGRETQPWLDGYALLKDRDLVVTRLYDHHGVVSVPRDARPCAIGSVVTLVPNHVCPVVNLSRYLLVVRDGRIVDRWDVAARAVT